MNQLNEIIENLKRNTNMREEKIISENMRLEQTSTSLDNQLKEIDKINMMQNESIRNLTEENTKMEVQNKECEQEINNLNNKLEELQTELNRMIDINKELDNKLKDESTVCY